MPANTLAQTTTQVIEYFTTDALGSVRAVTKQVNGTWQVVARHDFIPFGEEVAPPPPPSDKRLFTGKERDSETGMDYFEARYYRAEIARFTSVDPAMTLSENLTDPQRWNRYAYVRNNPLRDIDPDGRADVAAMCAGKTSCDVTVQQTLNFYRYDEKSKGYVVYSTVSVATTFSISCGSAGAVVASTTSAVANVSGYRFSQAELSTMGSVIGQIQGSGVFRGFGSNTTQMLTAIAAKESALGAAAGVRGASPTMAPAINPMQYANGRASLDRQFNIEGALGVLEWAGRPSAFDPLRSYTHYSHQSTNTVNLFMLFYNNLSETVVR